MKRTAVPARPDWRARVRDLGLTFDGADGLPYWTDDAAWEFTQGEIETIELAAARLHGLALDAARAVIEGGRLAEIGITGVAAELATASWAARDPYVYGRLDLAWDGTGEPKLLEYNADTPTSLIEAAVIQWDWLNAQRAAGHVPAQADQFNAVEEALVAAWAAVPDKTTPMFFACVADLEEDRQTTDYLRSTAAQAGHRTVMIDIGQIGWREDVALFVDTLGLPIRRLFKLHPWEHMAAEGFGRHLRHAGLKVVEPAWKLVLQSKGLLAVMWAMFEGHPNLLPASLADNIDGASVRKPFFSREGANIRLTHPLGPYSLTTETPGDYGAEGHVHQAYTPLAATPDGGHAVIGAWVTSGQPRFAGLPRHRQGGDPCGLTIREHAGVVTGNASRIVPHWFTPDPANPPTAVDPATGLPAKA